MPAYHPVFLSGECVRIKPLASLKSYCAPEWPYHNPLPREHLDFADSFVSVASVSYYHGGDVLYELRGVPGYWHEPCLDDALLHTIEWEGYPDPSKHFTIDGLVENGLDYVVVRTRDGIECLRKTVADPAEDEARKMREVAQLRHFRGFLDRYGFWCPFKYQ